MWAEVRERFGVDLRQTGEPDGPTVKESWAYVHRLLNEMGTATWAAAEGDLSLIGYTEAVMTAENQTLIQLQIAHAQGGNKNYKPPRNRLEASRHRRAGMKAAEGGVEAMAAFFGIPLDQLDGWDED